MFQDDTLYKLIYLLTYCLTVKFWYMKYTFFGMKQMMKQTTMYVMVLRTLISDCERPHRQILVHEVHVFRHEADDETNDDVRHGS